MSGVLTLLLNYNGNSAESFKVGMAFAVAPLDITEKSMLLIYSRVEELIKRLNDLGIPIVQLESIYDPKIIIDS